MNLNPSLPPGWLQPAWPAPGWVGALFATRAGGVSEEPWGSLNAGGQAGDVPGSVRANRERLALALGARPVFLRQVHGARVIELGPESVDGAQADGAVTQSLGIACTVQVADCLPVLLAHRQARVVAAAHAGWRGLAAGVLERTFERFWELARRQENPANRFMPGGTLAWLGPAIGPRRFEVGGEVRAAFLAGDAQAAGCFHTLPGGKFLADLPALARRRLARMGITHVYGNDGGDGWCTMSDAARFHSYRRDQARLGGAGRMTACIWLQ
ncbi:MAG: peptidoglycan editing factor PgeF [Burkholderiaceae bacterium]|jgi:YfiH family protein|nr:peptidoglycan editing factor PgeF [Burkholderiaceae bacterium]